MPHSQPVVAAAAADEHAAVAAPVQPARVVGVAHHALVLWLSLLLVEERVGADGLLTGNVDGLLYWVRRRSSGRWSRINIDRLLCGRGRGDVGRDLLPGLEQAGLVPYGVVAGLPLHVAAVVPLVLAKTAVVDCQPRLLEYWGGT